MDHDAFGKRWRDASTLHMRVDMSNLVFHRSMMSRLNLSGRCGEDKELFRKLLQVGGKMRYQRHNRSCCRHLGELQGCRAHRWSCQRTSGTHG